MSEKQSLFIKNFQELLSMRKSVGLSKLQLQLLFCHVRNRFLFDINTYIFFIFLKCVTVKSLFPNIHKFNDIRKIYFLFFFVNSKENSNAHSLRFFAPQNLLLLVVYLLKFFFSDEKQTGVQEIFHPNKILCVCAPHSLKLIARAIKLYNCFL